MQYLLKDSNGKPSVTYSAFVIGFVVATLKFLVSGIEIYAVKLPEFSGADYSISLAALGALYILRRSKDEEKKSETAE